MHTPKEYAELQYRLYETRNPFEVAKQRNLQIFFKPLGNIYGFYYSLKRSHFIYINSDIDEPLQIYTCAHEVGHDILHRGLNTPFLAKHTLQSIDKIEKEANQFAVELLIPDMLLLEGMTIYESAKMCGVPEEVAHLKQIPLKGF